MPKSKPFWTTAKRASTQKSTNPESANEFLAVGVEFEEAGEKWRAGHTAKSTRFFIRALDNYDAGLSKHPRSFDLAFNKARLQYDLGQQPRLLSHLPYSLIDLLQLALESHRYALAINQDNADLLFNTAQVLTSLVEAATELKHPVGSQIDGLRLLQEALELFQRCLSLQEYELAQQEDQNDTPIVEESKESDLCSAERSEASNGAGGEETWASIEQPVTRNSLVDALIAQLETLTIVCGLVVSQGSGNLGWIEEYHRVLEQKIAPLANGTDRTQEANLVNAKFSVAFADASCRHGQLGLLEYERELDAAFNAKLDLTNHPQGLCDRADAEATFCASIQAMGQSNKQLYPPDSTCVNEILWKHITKSLDDLTAASKIPLAANLPLIHLRRGDCELLRYQLGQGPDPHGVAAKSASTLVRNAEVYYRGAAGLARNASIGEEEREASVKEAVTAALSGNRERLEGFMRTDGQAISEIIEDMREEGLLSSDDLRR